MAVFVRTLLAIGALTAIALSLAILVLPGPFYAGYGIDPGGNVSLLNELKAPSLLILALGVLQALALFDSGRNRQGLWAGLLLYLGFGLARLVAVATDGQPSPGLIVVAGVELLLGLLFALALWRQGQG